MRYFVEGSLDLYEDSIESMKRKYAEHQIMSHAWSPSAREHNDLIDLFAGDRYIGPCPLMDNQCLGLV